MSGLLQNIIFFVDMRSIMAFLRRSLSLISLCY